MKHKHYPARVSFCNNSDTHIGNNVQTYKFQNYTNVHSHQSSLYFMYAAEMQTHRLTRLLLTVEAVYMLPNLTKLLLTLAHTLVVKYQDSSQEISAKEEEDKIN